MTDTKPEIQPAAHPAAPEKNVRKARKGLAYAFVLVLLLAVALGAALWYQQQAFRKTNAELVSQVQVGASAANQASEQAQQALSLAREQSAQISALQRSLRESKSQYQSLEQAFQNLTDSGSDLVLINDTDHLVSIAHQQLLLGGNVGNAIIALETAQARLAQANRPALAALQQTINGDLDHLRAASTIDITRLSAQLDELSRLISRAPLLIPDDAAPKVVSSPKQRPTTPIDTETDEVDPDASWWQRSLHTVNHWAGETWWSVRQDLGDFISVRRVDDASALLMSPDQASRLREILRLRIMTAKLALMMHQPEIWRTETGLVAQALGTRYDALAADTQKAVKLGNQLADTSIDVKLPSVNNSIQALDALREANAKAAEQKAAASMIERPSDPAASSGSSEPSVANPPAQLLKPAPPGNTSSTDNQAVAPQEKP